MSVPRVLVIGIDPIKQRRFFNSLVHCEVQNIPMDFEAIIAQTLARARAGSASNLPDLIICGEPAKGMSIGELGQTLRMQYPEPPLFCIVEDRHKYHRVEHLRDGFTDAFFFPFEAAPLNRAINHQLRLLTKGKVRSYRPVRVEDLRLGSKISFGLDVFLPLNSKYLPFLRVGSSLTEDLYDKLMNHRVDSMFVNTDELPEFYDYARATGITERRHQIEDAFRVLMAGIFRGSGCPMVDEGRKFVVDCQNAIQSLILAVPMEQIPAQILALMGDVEDYYNHSLNVATYAALFSKVLGIGDPLVLGMAGILHEVGEVDLPVELILTPVDKRTPEQTLLYESHVDLSLNLIRELKLTVGEPVMLAINHHHERLDGKGYPKRLQSSLFPVESQILALADRFDYLTRIRAGETARSSEELLASVQRELIFLKDRDIVDRDMVRRITTLLGKQKKTQAA